MEKKKVTTYSQKSSGNVWNNYIGKNLGALKRGGRTILALNASKNFWGTGLLVMAGGGDTVWWGSGHTKKKKKTDEMLQG